MKLNGCVHALQILNGGAPCQQIDSEEEDEQEAEADDEVSCSHGDFACPVTASGIAPAVLRCVALCCAVLCCAVLCCAVLCCAVLCCAVLCCAVPCCVVTPFAHFRMESLLCGFTVRAKLAIHHPPPFLPWQVIIMSKFKLVTLNA